MFTKHFIGQLLIRFVFENAKYIYNSENGVPVESIFSLCVCIVENG